MATEAQAPAIPMVTLTIDGQEVSVPKGTNVIEAARKLNIDIPYLCYHHQLTPFGGCRLCLVEVEKVPKLLAGCNTLVADGMVVRTQGAKIESQRAGTLEFLLINHPLDCPVCDKGGECELQDRVFQHSNAMSRMTEPKIHVEDYDLGPLIVRNQDRCIICKRCVKVMEDIVGDPVLEFGQRGVTTEVYTFEHEDFPAGFSGNTIRVCPVGALTSKPFRFKARPWELIKTPSVCSLCSVGCNLREDVRENRLLRVVGLENKQVNDGWLCDRGQFGYDYVQSPNRLRVPLVRKNGQLQEASWEEAYKAVADGLTQAKSHGAASVGVLGSERASNEDNYVLQEFARTVLGTNNIDHRMGGRRTDYAPTRPAPGAIEALGKADVTLLFASDLTSEAPVLDLVLKRGLLPGSPFGPGRMRLIVANPRRIELNRRTKQWLRYGAGSEIALLHALLFALAADDQMDATLVQARGADAQAVAKAFAGQTLDALAQAAGITAADIRATAAALFTAQRPAVVYGTAAVEGPEGEAVMTALRTLSALVGQAQKPGSVFLEAVRHMNTWGARDMGTLPTSGPGGASVTAGMSTTQMVAAAGSGQLKSLYVMGSNPVAELPQPDRVREALSKLEFLVVQDMFLTETAALAHVVLPSVSPAEENSTVTNVEGRVQRTVRAMNPIAASKADWDILNEVARAMGQSLGYSSVDSVVKAIRGAVTSVNGTGTALPAIQPAPAAVAADGFPLRMLAGALMFDRSTIQRESTVLPTLAPDPYLEINPADATTLGLSDGDMVTVASPHGSITRQTKVSDATPAGAVFVPEGYNESPVGQLLSEAYERVSVRVSKA